MSPDRFTMDLPPRFRRRQPRPGGGFALTGQLLDTLPGEETAEAGHFDGHEIAVRCHLPDPVWRDAEDAGGFGGAEELGIRGDHGALRLVLHLQPYNP